MSELSLDRLCQYAEDGTQGIINATRLKQTIRATILVLPAIFAWYITDRYGYWEKDEWNRYVVVALVIATLVTVAGIVWLVKGRVELFTKPLGRMLLVVALASIALWFLQDKAKQQRDKYRDNFFVTHVAEAEKTKKEYEELLKGKDDNDRNPAEEDRNISPEDLLKDFGAFRRKLQRTFPSVIKAYEGKEVTWTLLLSHVGDCFQSNHKRQFLLSELDSTSGQEKKGLGNVSCKVTCSKYDNELLNVDQYQGGKVRVHGTIRFIGYLDHDKSYMVYLTDDPEIIFLSQVTNEK